MNQKRVLIVRLSSMGDVIFNLPLAKTLKDNGYEVSWIVGEKGIDILRNNPVVDEVILVQWKKWKNRRFWENFALYLRMLKRLREKKYDIAIDTQGLLKSFIWTAFCGAKRRIVSKSAREFAVFGGNEVIEKLSKDYNTHVTKNYLKFAKHIGIEAEEITACLPPSTKDSIEKIDSLLKDIDTSKPLIGLAPATTWVPKHWDKDKWKHLVEELEKNYTLVFTGTSKDSDLISHISGNKHLSLAGKTSVLELMEFFRRCDLVISLDSGSTHLAWASQKPKIISIFCCTPKGLYAPIGPTNKYIALSGNLDCQPCHKKHCPLKEGKNLCTLKPSVEEVLNSVEKLLPVKS